MSKSSDFMCPDCGRILNATDSGYTCPICGWKSFSTHPQKKDEPGFDFVNSPPHYTTPIECIEAIKAALGTSFKAYLQGNILKYVWRYEKKNGVQDLEKAEWYLKRLIQEVKGE